jgi:tRNA pseudouridine55 synthase
MKPSQTIIGFRPIIPLAHSKKIKFLERGMTPLWAVRSLLQSPACDPVKKNPRLSPPKRLLDGVLFLDKPQGPSSHQALQKARWLLNAAKAGHTGTLDPMATGLLPLAFGESTKFSQSLLDADKTYLATLCLGVETDSGDAEGSITATHDPSHVDAQTLEAALTSFLGPQLQVPPMYSALKKDGKPLYAYARAGIELEREPREVTVFSLALVFFEPPKLALRMRVSKGTYVRSLAMDLGTKLGCGAHLVALRRESVGPFSLAEAVTLQTLEDTPPPEREAFLKPVDALLTAYPCVELAEDESALIRQGRALDWPVRDDRGMVPGFCRLFGPSGFLGLGFVSEDGVLMPKRLRATS